MILRAGWVRQILWTILVWAGILTVIFVVTETVPGGPSDLAMELNPKISAESRLRYEQKLGLHDPLPARYGRWVKRLSHGDLGVSYRDGQKVSQKIKDRLGLTLTLNGLTLLGVLGLGIPLGVYCAARQGSLSERLVSAGAWAFYASPTAWLGLLLVWVFSLNLGVLPVSGVASVDHDRMGSGMRAWDFLRHLWLPALTGSLAGAAGLSRYVRESICKEMNQAYVRTAFAHGLSGTRVLFGHILPNALLPVVTLVGLSLPGLFGGSVVVESLFGLPGMGKLLVDSVLSRDAPVYLGILLVGSTLTLAGNLLADFVIRAADPRIRAAGDPKA